MIRIPLQKELAYYAPALALDMLFSPSFRRGLSRSLCAAALLLLVTHFLSSFVPVPGRVVTGLLLITASIWFTFFALESFYNTRRFRGSGAYALGDDSAAIRKANKPAAIRKAASITIEVARIVRTRPGDITGSFLMSAPGREVLERLAISPDATTTFIARERTKVSMRDIVLPETGSSTVADLAIFLFKHDKTFADFLFQNGAREDLYIGAVRFVSRSIERAKYRERWWSRRRLERISPLGADWSYGSAWLLEHFATTARSTSVFSNLALFEGNSYAEKQVEELSTILARAKEANAILVGEEGVGKRDVIVALENNIRNETVPPELLGKRVLVLDDDAFTAMFNTKALFEQNMIKLLQQAEKAGNVILALIDLPGFLQSVEALGVDISSLLDPYLASSDLHVIATAHPVSFHGVIETKPQLLQRFEKISIESPEAEGIIAILEGVITKYERQYGVRFTYAAIHAVATNADRYVPGGVMPDKAIDLLVEVLPAARSAGEGVITKEFIDNYVKEKTGAPIGAISPEEKETLLNLEEVLHRRVIGQNEAIAGIANAMRRARAGIQNPKRPVGSFLFLGPTGVGKTETTKALTATFFGDESKMSRLDMSEYNSAEALSRLIGGGGVKGPGDLSVMLTDHPYGVLLLDEFEKTTPEVKDLFLQILDEGIFTNTRGEQISARNVIIIATSNAGSDLIFKYGEEGGALSAKKDDIIDTIIENHIFKPELVNRFDGVILFHALKRGHLRDIARIMLERLKKRIHGEGYELIVNDTLVDLLVREGYDPQFGARPMQRVVQDRIEKEMATKILEGSLKLGSSIEFTESDFVK